MTENTSLLALLATGFVLVSLLGLASPGHAVSDSGHLVVLMYHRFDAGGVISTPMEKFKRQIRYLKDNDYNFVSLQTVIDHLQEGRPFPEKSVLLTIDDGYESTYTHAFPFLEKENVPWVLYVYTQAIEDRYSSSLSWDQIREMAEAGVPVENHTYSHGHPVSDDFRDGNWIQREIEDPHELIEKKTNQPVRTFAIPYGEYDTAFVDAIAEKYEVVWGIDPGVVNPGDPSDILPRFGINGSTSHEEFKKKLNRLPLDVEQVTPEPGTRLNQGNTVTIALSRSSRYRKGPINLFLSETGAMEWDWSTDGTSLVTSINEPLNKPWNRIILTVFDHEYGRYRYFSRGYVTGPSE